MKITFTGVPGEDIEDITVYGYTFHKGKAVDVTDRLAQTKLSNHPHFKGGDAPLEFLIQPQTIPSVVPTLLVNDGHQQTTLAEVDAINSDERMLPGYRVTAEQVLKAKGDADGDDFRVGTEGVAEADHSPARRGRKPGRPKHS